MLEGNGIDLQEGQGEMADVDNHIHQIVYQSF